MQIPLPGLVITLIGVSATVLTVGYRIGKNGSKAHGAIYKKVEDKVEITECHVAQARVAKSQDDLKDHINIRFDSTDKRLDDLREIVVKKNGKA